MNDETHAARCGVLYHGSDFFSRVNRGLGESLSFVEG